MNQKLMEGINITKRKANSGLKGTALVLSAFSENRQKCSSESGRDKSELIAAEV